MSERGEFPPDPDPELAERLSQALHAEAQALGPAGDGLARIQARTRGRRTAWWTWLWAAPTGRAVLSGAAVLAVLATGTLLGRQLLEDSGADSVAVQPPSAALPAGTVTAQPQPTPTPDDAEAATEAPATPSPTTTPAAVTSPTPSDSPIPADDGGNYVAITAPNSGAAVPATFVLEGLARVFEATVTLEVSQNGQVVLQDFATASAGAPEKGTWSKQLTLEPGNYRIDAFALSPADGQSRLAEDTIWLTVQGSVAEDSPAAMRTAVQAAPPGAGPSRRHGGPPGLAAAGPAAAPGHGYLP